MTLDVYVLKPQRLHLAHQPCTLYFSMDDNLMFLFPSNIRSLIQLISSQWMSPNKNLLSNLATIGKIMLSCLRL